MIGQESMFGVHIKSSFFKGTDKWSKVLDLIGDSDLKDDLEKSVQACTNGVQR